MVARHIVRLLVLGAVARLIMELELGGAGKVEVCKTEEVRCRD